MALNIRNDRVEELAATLAALTGETKTAAVGAALEERLHRVRSSRAGRSLADDLDAIAVRSGALPVLDGRTSDEIMGYDDDGVSG